MTEGTIGILQLFTQVIKNLHNVEDLAGIEKMQQEALQVYTLNPSCEDAKWFTTIRYLCEHRRAALLKKQRENVNITESSNSPLPSEPATKPSPMEAEPSQMLVHESSPSDIQAPSPSSPPRTPSSSTPVPRPSLATPTYPVSHDSDSSQHGHSVIFQPSKQTIHSVECLIPVVGNASSAEDCSPNASNRRPSPVSSRVLDNIDINRSRRDSGSEEWSVDYLQLKGLRGWNGPKILKGKDSILPKGVELPPVVDEINSKPLKYRIQVHLPAKVDAEKVNFYLFTEDMEKIHESVKILKTEQLSGGETCYTISVEVNSWKNGKRAKLHFTMVWNRGGVEKVAFCSEALWIRARRTQAMRKRKESCQQSSSSEGDSEDSKPEKRPRSSSGCRKPKKPRKV